VAGNQKKMIYIVLTWHFGHKSLFETVIMYVSLAVTIIVEYLLLL